MPWTRHSASRLAVEGQTAGSADAIEGAITPCSKRRTYLRQRRFHNVGVSMAEPYWTNRLARPDETDAIMELVRAVHGDAHPELNRAYFEWRYRSGTGFRAEVVMAEFEGKPIAILPMSIFDFQ